MEYIHLKKVHLFFYSKDSIGNFNFLLFKNEENENSHHMFNTIEDKDNGSIYSISRFLTTNFGNLLTDDFISNFQNPNKKIEIQNDYKNLEQYELWENDIFFFWLNKLSNNPIQYDSIKGEIIYFIEFPFISIDAYNSILLEKKVKIIFTYINKDNFPFIKLIEETKNIFNNIAIEKMEEHIKSTLKMKEEENYKTFIILSLKTPGKDQNGFFHFPALFQSLYRKNDENWIYQNVSTEGIPSDELLSKTKAIIIPGSNLSVYNDYDFLRKTEQFLKKLIEEMTFHNKYPKLKILGICFGMQIIVNALGGKVEKMKGEHRGKPEDIEIIDEKFYNYNFYKYSGVEKRKKLRICEAHGDEITQLPEEKYKIKIFGTSKSCKIEIMVNEKENILLIQGHPEYHPEFNSHRVAKFFIQFRNKIEPTKEAIEKFIANYLNDEFSKNVNSVEYRKLCYYFIKN